MRTYCIILLIVGFSNCFSQNIEETIYVATETFNSNRSEKSFSELLKKEEVYKDKITSKDEYLAYLFLLLNKANYLDKTNKQLKAVKNYEQALNIYNIQQLRTITDYDIIEYCLKPLGILYTKIGDYTNAEHTISNYIALAKTQDHTAHKISGAINLAQLYYTAGKFKDAYFTANNALSIKGITEEQRTKLKLIQTNSQLALSDINAIKSTSAKASQKTTLETKYNIAIAERRYEDALSYNKQLIEQAYLKNTFSARVLAKHYVKRAELYYQLNQFDNSLLALKKALEILLPHKGFKTIPEIQDLYAENTFIAIFDLLAVLQTNPDNALACYDRSFYVSQLLTSDLTAQQAKLIHLNANRKRSEACIQLLYNTYNTTKDSTLVKKAFLYAEHYKALVLKEQIGKKSLLKQHPNDSVLIREQQLRNQQEQLVDQLIKVQYVENTSQITKLRQDLSTVSRDLKSVKTTIKKKYPETLPVQQHLTDTLQAKLQNDDAAMSVYFYGDTSVFQFIITPKIMDLIAIKKDDNFDKLIKTYVSFFNNSSTVNNNITAFTTHAFQLYNTLNLSQIKSHKNVIIVPDGYLNFIPFESLITKPTSTTSYSKMPFIIKEHYLAYAISASLYVDRHPFEYDDTLLGIFPVFENSNLNLTYSLNEAESIKNKANTTYLMHTNATKNNMLEQANDYSILHISTHANSGGFSVPANIDFIDSKLYLNELYSLNLSSDLVVLSACETGIGKLQKGEGSMNMARGFRYAGIENLMVSLWKINDLSTSQIMASFYETLSNIQSPFIANHKSKLDYLNASEISNIKKSPYYWSAFAYYGDLTPEYTINYSKYILYGIGIIGVILLILGITFKTKNEQHT